MLHRFTKTQFDFLLTSNFSELEFFTGAISYRGKTLSRLALSDLCSLLWCKLLCADLVIDGTVRLSPACSWSSLRSLDLNCIARVLLFDYCTLTLEYGSYSPIINAYIDVLPSTPFITFLNYNKIDKDVVIKSYTHYIFRGEEYSSIDEVKDAVNEVYPSTKYNVNLIF